jgi:hypothetical protein
LPVAAEAVPHLVPRRPDQTAYRLSFYRLKESSSLRAPDEPAQLWAAVADQRDLERRVKELESELARLKLHRPRGVRYRSAAGLGDVPFLAIAVGPDPEKGETRGHAKGIIAMGDIATGVVALGGLARGLLAFGGLAVGGLTLGGLSIGALVAIGGFAIGGFAIGSVAIGGAAVGGVALGGGAAGYYACGGAAVGKHAFSPLGQDPEAAEFFDRYGLDKVCRGR